jgi:hypothetical protein
MGVACYRKTECSIAYGWVEMHFLSVSWLVGNIIEQINVLPVVFIECLLMVVNIVMFLLLALM